MFSSVFSAYLRKIQQIFLKDIDNDKKIVYTNTVRTKQYGKAAMCLVFRTGLNG